MNIGGLPYEFAIQFSSLRIAHGTTYNSDDN